MKNTTTEKKLTAGIVLIIVLALCLAITSSALVWATVTVENNLFHTGRVRINLNDGNPIIEEREFLFEPGMTVKKEFFIESESTFDVFYRIYFDDIGGELADVLGITVKDGEKVLYEGTPRSMTRDRVAAANDSLKPGERRTLTVLFKYPEGAGNDTQNKKLTFTLCAEAVQTKNNPYKVFD